MINYLILSMIFVPIALGLLPCVLKDTKKLNVIVVLACALELIAGVFLMVNAQEFTEVVSLTWFGSLGLNFKINGLGILQAVAASVIWVGSSIFSKEYFEHHNEHLRRYYSFFSITFGATLGVFLANDLITLFIFFEVMSFASYLLVVHSQDEEAIKAGNSYLTVAVSGGLMLLMGIFIVNNIAGTVVIDELALALSAKQNQPMLILAGVFMLFGFGAKAGLFPLSGWLPKAHPAAPAPASAALSGILIKSGIYGIIIITFKILQGNTMWASVIVTLGTVTMVMGAVCAFMSINLKETLAYSSMSQIGFISIGVGMTQLLGEHGTIAAYGTVLHMINHTLIKLVLFTIAGIVYKNAHSLDLNKIKGFGKGKPMLAALFSVSALGIMGIPFFNGYISKTLLHEAIVEKIWLFETYTTQARLLQGVEMIFLLSGGFTIAYMVKLFICLFVQNGDTASITEKAYMSKGTGAMLSIVSGLIFIFGAFPAQTLDKIASSTAEYMGVHTLEASVNYFSFANIKGALVSIVIGLILYFVVAKITVISDEKIYINPYKEKYHIDNILWQPLLFNILPFIGGFIGRIIDKAFEIVIYILSVVFMSRAKIPDTFFEGKKTAEDDKTLSPAVAITKSLAYSLLLFGVGFAITMLYLVFSGF